MLHSKSQGHRPSGSGEKDFKRGFPFMGVVAKLGHVTKTILNTLLFQHPKESSIDPVVSDGKCLKMLNGRRSHLVYY